MPEELRNELMRRQLKIPHTAGGLDNQPYVKTSRALQAYNVYEAFYIYSNKSSNDVEFSKSSPSVFDTVTRVEVEYL